MTTPTTEPLWSDDARPWVNEEMNEGSMLGLAACTISRWGQEWHKSGKDKDQYDSAHNDMADMADVITSLLVDIDARDQRIVQLEAELAEALIVAIARGEKLGYVEADGDYRARYTELTGKELGDE